MSEKDNAGFGFRKNTGSASRNETMQKAMAMLKEKPLEGELITRLDADVIHRDVNQPRKKIKNIESLAASMEANSQIQPIVVRPYPGKSGHYILVVGERRWSAAKLNGMTLNTIVRDFTDDDLKDVFRIQIIENRERDAITALEDCHSVKRYVDEFCAGHQRQAAQELGVSEQYVSKRMQLLGARQEVLQFADEDVVNDIDALVMIKKLYETNQEAGSAWMAEAREGKIEGSIRKSAQASLKKVKTGRKPKKLAVKSKAGRVVKFSAEDDLLAMSVFNQSSEESKFIFPIADLNRLLDELTAIRDKQKGALH